MRAEVRTFPVEWLKRCVAHAHQMMSSPETFPLIEEVRRRWH